MNTPDEPDPPDAPPHPRIPGAPAAHQGGPPLRALIAARLSQLQRDGSQGMGIDIQDEKSRAFCEREGMHVVHVAADTKSGTVAPWDRKNLRPWVTDPEMIAQYDVIVALKTDRISRGDQQDFTRIEFWAIEHGKRLIIVDGPQYPARKDGHHDSDYWQWHAEKMAARKEWESIRDRSVRATDRLLREARFTGKPPWGYTTEGPKYDKRMVATPEGRELIPQIFDKVIAGQSLAEICAWLDTLHVKQRRDPETGELADTPWWPSGLLLVIRNETYRGRYTLTRTDRDPETGQVVRTQRYEYPCEPLIDARRFRLANEAVTAREKRGPAGGPETNAMLKGAIKCPNCGASLNKQKSRKSRRPGAGKNPYYRCGGRGPQRKGCGNMVRMEKADAAVDEIMATTFDVPVRRMILIPGTDYTDELEEIRYRIRELDPAAMTDEEYDAELRKLRAERDRLKALPVQPDRWEEQLTGERYCDIYAALPPYERGPWLKKHGFLVHATKYQVTVCQGDVEGTIQLD